MQARLTFYLPDRPAQTFVARDGGDYLLGRDPACDVRLDDDRVSRRHARLRETADGWRLEDLGSKNGLSVAGRAAGDGRLEDGDWLSLGGLPVRFDHLTGERREAESRRLERRWRTSLDLQRDVDPQVGLDRLLRRVLRSVLTLAEAERGLVLLADEHGRLEIAARASVSDEDLAATTFSASVGAIERTVASGRAVVTSDAQADTLLGERPSIVERGVRGLACVPLTALGRTLGVVYVDSDRPGISFDELDVEILESLANHAALAISAARLDRELKGLAGSLPTRVGLGAGASGRLRSELGALWDRAVPRAAATPVDGGDVPGEAGGWGAIVSRHLAPERA